MAENNIDNPNIAEVTSSDRNSEPESESQSDPRLRRHLDPNTLICIITVSVFFILYILGTLPLRKEAETAYMSRDNAYLVCANIMYEEDYIWAYYGETPDSLGISKYREQYLIERTEESARQYLDILLRAQDVLDFRSGKKVAPLWDEEYEPELEAV